MKGYLIALTLAIASVRMDDSDDVIIEDIEDTATMKKSSQEPVQRVTLQHEDAPPKPTPKILKKYENIKDINKYQIVAMESMSLIKEFQDIAASSTFVDGNVMLELQRKSDEVNKLANDLQIDFQNMSTSEQKSFMEEYKQLLFNALPQRLRHFKELSASHLSLHQQLMESTLDVLRDDTSNAGLVDYIESRLRHRQFSSESKLREMIKVQQRKRNKWYFGLTRLEWIMLTGQIWLVGAILAMLRAVMGTVKGGARNGIKVSVIFEVCLFAMIAGLVNVELSKYFITWSFPKMRVLGISAVQFLFLSMLREMRKSCGSCFSNPKKHGKSVTPK